jgi:hypothetical protein
MRDDGKDKEQQCKVGTVNSGCECSVGTGVAAVLDRDQAHGLVSSSTWYRQAYLCSQRQEIGMTRNGTPSHRSASVLNLCDLGHDVDADGLTIARRAK